MDKKGVSVDMWISSIVEGFFLTLSLYIYVHDISSQASISKLGLLRSQIVKLRPT